MHRLWMLVDGALETGIRWSHIDLSDQGIDGGNMNVFSVAANWWLKKDLNFNANWRYIELDRYGDVGHSQALVARLTFLIE